MENKEIFYNFSIESEPVLNYLLRKDPESTHPKLETTLDRLFPSGQWKTHCDYNVYADESTYANLYKAESGKQFNEYLTKKGITVERYAETLGSIQFNAIRAQLISIFPDRNGTKGWKVVMLGFPSLGLVLVGLEHHYGDSRSQAQLGEASRRLRTIALEHLPPDLPLLDEFPAATAADWDERGLMANPVLSIGDLDISDFDAGRGAKLRFVRNTTAKKEISTLMFRKCLQAGQARSMRDLDDDVALSEFDVSLIVCRQIARELGRRGN